MRTKWLGASLLLVSAGALATLEDAQNAFKKGDYQGAVKEYRTLAEAGNVNAQIILGALYSKGGVVKRDDKTAISWLEKAAIQGNVYSNYLLGKIYEGSE